MTRGCAVVVFLLGGTALADPMRLRLATPAPEGSAYARELNSFSREVLRDTDGHIEAKWYMSGIAGDELTQIERMRRGQLDGAGLALGCDRLAPSLLAVRVVGLVRSRDEASIVLRRSKASVDQEMAHSGFVALGLGTLGSVVAMTRTPVRTFADLRKLRLWVWDKDEIQIQLLRAMGLQPVPLSIEAGGAAYDEGRIDGFLSVPTAALAFQWSARTHYFLDFPLGEISACFVMSQRAFDALPLDERTVLAAAAAKLSARVEEVGRQLDAELLERLFERQGLKRLTPDASFVDEFLQDARRAREQLDEKTVPPELISRALGWLADYRAEHSRQPTGH
ncbi:MAG: TRAP transporter substrate-binding protein DctP [Polyangia bacterium]